MSLRLLHKPLLLFLRCCALCGYCNKLTQSLGAENKLILLQFWRSEVQNNSFLIIINTISFGDLTVTSVSASFSQLLLCVQIPMSFSEKGIVGIEDPSSSISLWL